MARLPRDPLLKVIRYFQDVPLDTAKAALVVVADTVHRRLQEGGQLPAPRQRKVKSPSRSMSVPVDRKLE